ncbi:MAG: hypothetical protein AUI14_10760 [Actinobacteria bacterium 13_2_20CM_2_71_6]|jgi:hypothetical protein|nr:MAG: hypothetical protein AUI14_10760 [Actinobacteria bacterium 13_2_20CM_2_71_6]
MGWHEVRNLGWSLGILAVVGSLAFGLPAVNAALPAARAVPTDQPYPLGHGVSVVPPPGAQLDVTRSVPGSTLFVLGGVRYLLVVMPFDGTLEDAAAQVRQKITANRGYQVTGPETPAATAQGVTGKLGGYTSPGRNGRYAVFLRGGTGVQVTVAGADLELRPVLPMLITSMTSIAFPPS